MPKENEHTLRLSDERRLSYTEYGDPSGNTVVLYFHGWPTSRLDGQVLDIPARDLGIRVIAPDRPGFGRSDPQPERTILDWPKDITKLADHLQIETFSLVGA